MSNGTVWYGENPDQFTKVVRGKHASILACKASWPIIDITDYDGTMTQLCLTWEQAEQIQKTLSDVLGRRPFLEAEGVLPCKGCVAPFE